MDFSHLDKNGKPCMVDVSGKPDQKRIAVASGIIQLKKETIALIESDRIKKGNVMVTAQIAGIQAAKKTSELIPLCHSLLIKKVEVDTRIIEQGICVESTVVCIGQTGVEMEALHAVSTALLTIYDMCKAVDKSMILGEITLLEKTKKDIKQY